MSGFILNKGTSVRFDKANAIFQKSGLPSEKTYTLGEWNLKLYSNENNKGTSCMTEEGGRKSFLIGTLLFKGSMGEKALTLVHKEFYRGTLDHGLLKGNFILLFWDGTGITLLHDRLGVQQIFQRNDGNCFSNSFLALLVSSDTSFKLDENALNEKLATGFLTGSHTLVRGIQKVDRTFPFHVNEEEIRLLNHPEFDLSFSLHDNGKKKSINAQIDLLEDYFKEINTAKTELQGDVGLSSGFDCRLIVAAAKNTLETPLHIHSHNTKGVHDNEIRYARQIAKVYGTEIHLVPTSRLEDSDEQLLEKTLKENLYFFDGRSARHLGALSETYTYWYRKESMGAADYSLNGLGGEIYRDSYFMGKRNLKWDEWAQRFLFFPLSEFAVGGEKTLKEISRHLKIKIENKLNTVFDKADIFKTHAHYGLMKMPECNGSLAQAYGKVSEFLFPFIEYNQITEALKATPYLSIGGSYQAKLITKISPEIAAVSSHYGFPFDKLSFKYLMWSYIKSTGPAKTREALVKEKLMKKIYNTEVQKFLALTDKSPYLSKVKKVMLERFPDMNFDLMMSHNKHRRINLFLGTFLLEFADYID